MTPEAHCCCCSSLFFCLVLCCAPSCVLDKNQGGFALRSLRHSSVQRSRCGATQRQSPAPVKATSSPEKIIPNRMSRVDQSELKDMNKRRKYVMQCLVALQTRFLFQRVISTGGYPDPFSTIVQSCAKRVFSRTNQSSSIYYNIRAYSHLEAG